MKENMINLYNFNNVNIYKYNLLHYLNNKKKNKKKLNNLLLNYEMNINNYEEHLVSFIDELHKIPEYMFIPIY